MSMLEAGNFNTAVRRACHFVRWNDWRTLCTRENRGLALNTLVDRIGLELEVGTTYGLINGKSKRVRHNSRNKPYEGIPDACYYRGDSIVLAKALLPEWRGSLAQNCRDAIRSFAIYLFFTRGKLVPEIKSALQGTTGLTNCVLRRKI